MTDSTVIERDSRTRRPSLLPGTPVRLLGEWLVGFLDRHVPLGYEDKTGFHCGARFQSNQSTATSPGLQDMMVLPGGDLI
jgi:hypothetical protein